MISDQDLPFWSGKQEKPDGRNLAMVPAWLETAWPLRASLEPVVNLFYLHRERSYSLRGLWPETVLARCGSRLLVVLVGCGSCVLDPCLTSAVTSVIRDCSHA